MTLVSDMARAVSRRHVALMQAAPKRVAPTHVALLCFLLGLLGGLPLVFLTPPLQVADEGQHLLRAYQLSELRIWSRSEDDMIGDTLPTSLRAFLVRFLGTASEHAERPVMPRPLAKTLAERAVPLAPEDRSFIGFKGAAFYAPLAYLPQALAMRAARAFDAGPLALLYAGRIANLLATLGLLAAAVRIVPYGKAPMLVAALLPMALYQYASLSPDAMVIGCAFLFTALALRAQSAGTWTWRDLVAAIVAGTVVCSLKPVYVPLLLIGLSPGAFRGQRQMLGAHALILGCVIGATWLWLHSTASVFSLPRPGTSVREQMLFVLVHPLVYAGIVMETLRSQGVLWLQSMIGVFGWVKILPSPILFVLPAAAMLLACAGDETPFPRPSIWVALWQLALVLACGLFVITSLYLIWTPVGAGSIEGVQGRYFLPLLGAVAVGIGGLWPKRVPRLPLAPEALAIMLVTIFLAQVALTDLTIVGAYAVF